jgi:cytochrome b561
MLRAVIPRASKLLRVPRRTFTAEAAEAAQAEPDKYAKPLRLLHWGMAAGFIGCVGFAKAAQNTKDMALKGNFMFYHKSCGLLMLGLLGPRLAYRLTRAVPKPLPGLLRSARSHACACACVRVYACVTARFANSVAQQASSSTLQETSRTRFSTRCLSSCLSLVTQPHSLTPICMHARARAAQCQLQR